MDHWRYLLYYPLGLLPAIFFTSRFLLQWWQSEKAGKSIVSPLFWKLSLAGNCLAACHYLVQLHYPLMLIQVLNGWISLRNLQLMSLSIPPLKIKRVGWLVGFSTLAFGLCSYLFLGTINWIALPANFSNSLREGDVALSWHLIGSMGQLLFASRFWFQWWESEKGQKSQLTSLFWKLSLAGSLLSTVYFLEMRDWVSLLNYSFGMIPYLRNLRLMSQKIDTSV